jgi:hypothetical protein
MTTTLGQGSGSCSGSAGALTRKPDRGSVKVTPCVRTRNTPLKINAAPANCAGVGCSASSAQLPSRAINGVTLEYTAVRATPRCCNA